MSHGEFLRAFTRDDLLVYHLQHDHRLAEVNAQERAMLDYAAKLNDHPSTVSAADVQSLRDTGFDDQGVLDIAMIVCTFNFMNRLADGLGVQVDKGMEKSHERGTARALEALAAGDTAAKKAGD